LNLLLKDVINGNASYKAILVYDVSRWGRFQDADEAAHYEFICRSAGIQIHYCAETFENDGSLSAIVMKALKRAMAREFSRELSMKTSVGKKRVAQMGFRPGGMAGFGLRRMLIAADGSRRRVLQKGDYKAVANDRVILVPGPPEEVACVREIFEMCLEGNGFAAIARKLNFENVDCPNGKWKPNLVREILTNPKYIGWLVWGRVEDRLTGSPRKLPMSQWIIKPDVFEPIVDKSTFLAAQHAIYRSHGREDCLRDKS
jgi:DNA invertase Pin-like site-specific DNA recombinase